MEQLDAHIVALTHYLPPYIKEVMIEIAKQTRRFDVLLSTRLEPNRKFVPDFSGLDVTLQKSWMIRRPWNHGAGFQDELYVHVPYDTFSQLRRAKPDIIFSFELGVRSMISAIYRRLHHRSRLAYCVCVSEHTEQGRGAARLILRRWLIRQADAITYNGPSCLTYLKRFQVPDDRLFHFPYASMSATRYSGPLTRSNERSHRLVCVGQLIERKGVVPMLHGLIDFCRSKPENSIELTFIGHGPLEQALRETTLPSNLKVDFIGHVPPEDLCHELARHGILIFPTLADEWGLVVNEAMLAGLPVLGSVLAQACTTLIREGENGWLYDPREPTTLRDKLTKIMALNADELNKLRPVCKHTVDNITSSNSALQALEMFRKLRLTL
jgi:glycosyltransferase involved in cell wall biosynthesis